MGFLVAFTGSWIPSPWLDEAATAHIISYPISDMAQLWQQTDAVYAPYYVLMHFWVKLTGITPLALRMPSLLAVGVGTAAMAAAGRTMGGHRAQLLYALCFALLPRTAAMGIEARPYAISAMFMAIALLLVVKLRQGTSDFHFVLLGLAMLGAVSAQFFSLLPLVGLMMVAAVILSTRRSRIALLTTATLAGIACLPLGIAAVPQQSQVSWLGDGAYSIADQALVEAWFTSRWGLNPSDGVIPLHYIAVALSVVAGLAVIVALVVGRHLPKQRFALAVIPPAFAVAVLWGVSLVHAPVLLGRYLTSSTPFVAMLIAESLLLLRPYTKPLIASLLVIGCSLLIVSQRQPYAKIPGHDYAFIASALHAKAANGDGLLLEPGLGPVDSARNAIDLYPVEFGRLVDIAQPERPPLSFVFSSDPPVPNLGAMGPLPARIWLVAKSQQDSQYASQLNKLGFKSTSMSSGPLHVVTLWSRP